MPESNMAPLSTGMTGTTALNFGVSNGGGFFVIRFDFRRKFGDPTWERQLRNITALKKAIKNMGCMHLFAVLKVKVTVSYVL